MPLEHLETKLLAFENKYYIYVKFSETHFVEEDIDNMLSLLLEYADESRMTVHRIEEYGKVVLTENVFVTLSKHFRKNQYRFHTEIGIFILLP